MIRKYKNQLDKQLSVSQQVVSNQLPKMGKMQKVDRWVPHELNDRQMEKRKNTNDILVVLYKRKLLLHRIVTRDEKWIYFENPQRKKSRIDPGAPFTSTARPNRFGRKTIHCLVGPEGRGLLLAVKTWGILNVTNNN